MEALLKQLEQVKLGFVATPAPGDLTLGGVLAIDGHGTGIPAQGENRLPGQSYGSLSNSIVALTAVVWDGAAGQYDAEDLPPRRSGLRAVPRPPRTRLHRRGDHSRPGSTSACAARAT